MQKVKEKKKYTQLLGHSITIEALPNNSNKIQSSYFNRNKQLFLIF